MDYLRNITFFLSSLKTIIETKEETEGGGGVLTMLSSKKIAIKVIDL